LGNVEDAVEESRFNVDHLLVVLVADDSQGFLDLVHLPLDDRQVISALVAKAWPEVAVIVMQESFDLALDLFRRRL